MEASHQPEEGHSGGVETTTAGQGALGSGRQDAQAGATRARGSGCVASVDFPSVKWGCLRHGVPL